jgi:AhpD family alkylhydroperoxidase
MKNEAYLTTPPSEASAQQDRLPPRMLDALSLVHEKALQSKALGRKVKELIALATSVTTGCETSIAYHLHNALEAGATREEMVEAVEVAVVTVGEPAAVHAAQILRALDIEEAEQFSSEREASGLHGMRARAARHPYMPPD